MITTTVIISKKNSCAISNHAEMELSHELHWTLFRSCSRFRVIERNIIGNKMKFVTECILCCCVASTFGIGVACNCVFVTFVQLLSLGINSLKGENQRHPRQMVILFDSPKGLDSNGVFNLAKTFIFGLEFWFFSPWVIKFYLEFFQK